MTHKIVWISLALVMLLIALSAVYSAWQSWSANSQLGAVDRIGVALQASVPSIA